MKVTIIMEPSEEESFSEQNERDARALMDAVKNQRIIEDLYDKIFRPIIRYGTDRKEVEAFERVWKDLGPYLHGES